MNKTFNIHLKALKELADANLDISIGYKGGVRNFHRRLKSDLREAVTLSDDKHELYKIYGSGTMNWTNLPWPTKIAPGTTDLSSVFNGCGNLKELDVSLWETSAVQKLNKTFGGLRYIGELDISGLDTSEVEQMSNLFTSFGFKNSAPARIIGIEDLDVSSVQTMQYMFSGANIKELDLRKWNVSNVANMGNMFQSSTIEFIDITGWETSKLTHANSIFNNCNSLREVRGVFDASSFTSTWELTHSGQALPKLEKPIQVKNVPRGIVIRGPVEILSYKE